MSTATISFSFNMYRVYTPNPKLFHNGHAELHPHTRWNYAGAIRTWAWEPDSFPAATELRCEVIDQGAHEDVVVFDIEILVR